MKMVISVLLLCCGAIVAQGRLSESLDAEEIAVVQERLEAYEMLSKLMQDDILEEADRAKECLPVGAVCNVGSGPNCCGLSVRCNLYDTQLPAKKKGEAPRWISKCRKSKILDKLVGN